MPVEVKDKLVVGDDFHSYGQVVLTVMVLVAVAVSSYCTDSDGAR